MDNRMPGVRRATCTILLAIGSVLAAAWLGGCASSARPDTPLTAFAHSTVLIETPVTLTGNETAVGPVTPVAGGFSEALLSINVDVPENAGVVAEIRVGQSGDDFWSAWMPIVAWGAAVPAAADSAPGFGGEGDARAGKMEIDTFVGRAPGGFDRVQHRLRSVAAEGATIRVRRVAICTTRESGERAWTDVVAANTPAQIAPLTGLRFRTIDVPFRSQFTARPEIAGRICSPTSVSMVLAYRGKRAGVLDVANCAFDEQHDIYGNWPRNIQAAYTMGVKGYLTRISSWDEAAKFIARGTPLVISVRVKKRELPAAPYKDTDGHLIVLTGFTTNGEVTVNDPAVSDEKEGRRVYPRADMERVWMSNTAGTTYVLGE